jgi:hypothetical protein
VFDLTLTDNLQYQRQFVGNDNITQRDQRKNCANASGHIHTYLQNCILKVLLSPIGANFELIPAHFENMEIFSWFFLQFFDESVSAKFQ